MKKGPVGRPSATPADVSEPYAYQSEVLWRERLC